MVARIGTSNASSLTVNLVLVYLVIGLLFQLLYHGFPWPFSLYTWLHILLWPLYVVLGMLRWIFYPFALIAIIGLVGTFLYSRHRA